MYLPTEIIPLLESFRPAFTEPTYRKAIVLAIGAILSKDRRTVASALRVLGMEQTGDWSKYHHVLNRAKWNGLLLSRILLYLIIENFVEKGAAIEITVDETLERRWGPKISKRGHWRDSLASGRKMNVSTSGLRWLVFAVVVKVPWSNLYWSLPFLSVLLTTPKVSEMLEKEHRTVAKRTGQVICWLRRTLPGRKIKLIGDGGYSVIDLGARAQSLGVTLIAPLQLNARLFDYPPSRVLPSGEKRRGRPALVGQRLANLEDVAKFKSTCWHRCRIDWYGGESEFVDWTSGVALWYSTGKTPLLLRWVLVRDPKGKRKTVAFFSTDIHQSPPSIIADFVKRWSLEVVFEESRAHLGIETQRQWSDKAIERTTPALFGIFSLVALMAHAIYPDGELPLPQAAWYHKSHASFHDLLALVRSRLWSHFLFQTPVIFPDICLFSHHGPAYFRPWLGFTFVPDNLELISCQKSPFMLHLTDNVWAAPPPSRSHVISLLSAVSY
jgi:hypothetical protein